jgi:hypothetical protein
VWNILGFRVHHKHSFCLSDQLSNLRWMNLFSWEHYKRWSTIEIKFMILAVRAVQTVMKMAVFWDVAQCSLVEVYRCFRGACCLAAVVLTIKAASTSETSVNFYRTIRRNIPEDSHIHTHIHFHTHTWEPEISPILAVFWKVKIDHD